MVVWRVVARDAPDVRTNARVAENPENRDYMVGAPCLRLGEANVVITFTGFDATRGTVAARVSMWTMGLLSGMRDATTGKRIVSIRDNRATKPEYANRRFSVNIGGEAVATLRLSSALVRQPARLAPAEITLHLQGQPDAYPRDWYTYSGDVTVLLPPGMTHAYAETAGARGPIPVRVVLRRVPQLRDFALRWYRRSDNGGVCGRYGVAFSVRIDRQPATRAFVFVVLSAPLVLALCLIMVLAIEGGVHAPELRDLLVGVTAATFAVLPLRAVLVPQDIEGLTLVDWWLGAELLIFIAVALIGLTRFMGPTGRRR